MLTERELIGLLHRADWMRLCLSGEVSGADDGLLLTMISHLWEGHREAGGPFPPFPPFVAGSGAAPQRLTRLVVAPGNRYRKDSQDGQVAQGCDGEHVWAWLRDPPPATLHQWSDPVGLLAAVPPSARKAGFGGVGFLVDTLAAASEAAAQQPTVCHEISSVRMEGWDKYRIDRTYGTPHHRRKHEGRRTEWVTVACDGRQRYQVYADRVTKGPPAPPPAELTDLIDASWLLGCRLSGGSEIMAGGRRAYRVAVSAPGSGSGSSLMKFFFPAVAVVDAVSGRLLRLTYYWRRNAHGPF
jgi:hypothetical protein